MKEEIMDLKEIENMIYLIRGQKVMLDKDLAKLYEVETKVFNQAIKRNIQRFPEDFMFQLNFQEFTNLRSQIVTSSLDYGGRRYLPYVFTESGVAMLSSVLKSERAISVNISIMRIFIRLRSYLLLENSVEKKLDDLEKGTNQIFKVVFERLDLLEGQSGLGVLPDRRKIGLK
jgi:hypothetical protein